MTDEERFKMWGEWIMVIHEDVQSAVLNRYIRQEVAAIIDVWKLGSGMDILTILE